MKKVAFYIDKTDSSPLNMKIYNGLNSMVVDKKVDDANVFFNDVAYNPISVKFGMFNGANIWHYTGNLICTTVENTVKALNSVNKFKLYYLYDRTQNINVYDLLTICGRVPVIVFDQVDANEYNRLTGEKVHFAMEFDHITSFLEK